MPHVKGAIPIHAPVEKVYAYLSDLPRMSDWCAPVVEARWLNRTPDIVDSTAEMVVKIAGQLIPSELVVLKADPPHHFSVRALTGVRGDLPFDDLELYAVNVHGMRHLVVAFQ